MKNYLAALVLVLLGMSAHAQNLTMSDLTNLAELGNTEAHNNLTFEKPFKQLYTQVIKGLTISHYQGTTPSSKSEMVIIGYGVKNGEGTFLHSVTYTSTNVKYIRNLLAQAQLAGLDKHFQGADANRTIYMYTNWLFTINVYINNDNSKGAVEIQENDTMDYD